MSSKSTSYCVVFLLAGFIATSGCSSSSNPAGPSDNNPSGSSTGRSGNLSVTVNPSPVPFDGKPITDDAACAQRPNTWYYELTLKESGGVGVTFSGEVDALDGFVVYNKTGLRVDVPANGEVKLNRRWCSVSGSRHTAQHTFTGTDANGNSVDLQTPVINLMAGGR